jgi:hypothetical protein
MARPEVFASAIPNDVASAGCHTVGNRSSPTHFENLLCDLFSNESQGRIRSTQWEADALNSSLERRNKSNSLHTTAEDEDVERSVLL